MLIARGAVSGQMGDNLYVVWQKFFQDRTVPLWNRFTGYYRAVVVETNDPLTMHRIKFKCPDMHDWNLAVEDCPWAVPAPEMGTKGQGRWTHPCVGDWVWITFERNHPYGPVWVGFADPTRRRYYALPAIFQRTPLSVNAEGLPVGRPNDFNPDYLPKDGRPMSHGWQDRYGNLDIHSSVGYFPPEHAAAPPAPDFDPLINAAFMQQTNAPQENDPDLKYMARITKYGHIFMLGDQGYQWKDDGADAGEFTGDKPNDETFEVDRWKYLQRLLNEDSTTGDIRSQLSITRYGHRFEMRDTGWAQPGPVDSKSRDGEYGPSKYLSKEMTNDFRWVKLRTKGGWLLQAYDKGFHPNDDEFVKRKLMDEIGVKSEQEDVHWANKDARWFRVVGRHGYKFVIDERGTSPEKADQDEMPRGNGFLMKGRRSPGSKNNPGVGNERGFYWEFNENDEGNHTTWGSPLGQAIEMNDATEYMALCVGLTDQYARPFRGLEENEFLLEPTRSKDPEKIAYHLVLDHQNEYLRLKTRSGESTPPNEPMINQFGLAMDDIAQGLEARCGTGGDGPWVELVDAEGRGLWFTKDKKLAILRSKKDKKMFVWMDDDTDTIVVHNDEDNGKIQIFCKGDVEMVTEGSINLKADTDISLKAGGELKFEQGGTAKELQDGGNNANDPSKINPPMAVEPSDRGQTFNTPSVIPQAEVEHPV